MSEVDERVTKEDFLAALEKMEKLKKEGKLGLEVTEYFIPYNGQKFPFKDVIRSAHDERGLDPGGFKTNDSTRRYVNRRGLPVLSISSYERATGTLKEISLHIDNYPEIKGLLTSKDEVVQAYSSYLRLENIDAITPEGLRNLPEPAGSAQWTLVKQKGVYARDIPQLKKILALLYGAKLNTSQRMNKVAGMAADFSVPTPDMKLTVLLALQYPNDCGIWDSYANDVLQKMNIGPMVGQSFSIGERYWAFNEILKCLAKDLGTDMWSLDALFRGVQQVKYHPSKGGVDDITDQTDDTIDLILKKRQSILFGPPGTGKTYHTKDISIRVINLNDEIKGTYDELREAGRVRFITFHPSYSYEEFVEGITVKVGKEGSDSQKLEYYLKDGIFKQMAKDCLKAALGIDSSEDLNMTDLIEKYRERMRIESDGTPQEQMFDPEEWWGRQDRYVLIIDEINRGDMSKILGELITLLEADKRLGMENELIVTLPYSRELFSVPPNLYIIGTMNTADKSIALLDVALRRRFGFIEMNPDIPLLREMIESRRSKIGNGLAELMVKSTDALEIINGRIAKERSIGRDKCIGHAFFFKVESEGDLLMVWRNEIIPTLDEYCYGRQNDLSRILFGTDNGAEYFDEVMGFKGLNDAKDLLRFLEGVKRG